MIRRGRWTHEHADGVVVFMIGMRVNRPWRPDLWLPVFAAMPPMLSELYRDPSSGFLGHRTLFGAGGPTLVQYWRDVESVYRYASDPAAKHRPAWSSFNRQARTSHGAVGIWHETYVVPRGHHETVYVDMPPTGLAKATGAVQVTGHSDSARQRLRAAD